MLKSFTLSLSLAVALGASSVTMAGIFPSAQGPSPVSPCASPQCDTGCAPKKHCFTMPKFNFPKPTCSYEWVLKKKITWCRNKPCAPTECAMPSAQCASPQTYGSGQAYPTTYGSGQAYPSTYGSGQAYGSGQLYGSGQATGAAPAGQMNTMTPAAPAGDEAPVAPEAPAPAGDTPAPPPPSAPGPQSSLLFSTPSGN